MRGFSLASTILSYFLVGGGMFAGTLLVWVLKITDEAAGYTLLAGGAFAGGFVAARASRGRTLIEPAIGAVAVIGTIIGLAASTDIGKLIWIVAQDETIRFAGTVGVSCVGGAFIGAYASEKLLGQATLSSIPWVIYTALSAFGACVLATLVASFLFVTHGEDPSPEALAMTIMIGIGSGCLIAGLAVGASARSRPLIASFLGGGAGVAGFFSVVQYLVERAAAGDETDAVTAIAVLAGGGAILTLIGTALGWVIVGRRLAVRVYDRATE